MNCFFHPSEQAVAQCVDCQKGLCHTCASKYVIPICDSCNHHRRHAEMMTYIKPLILCLVLYIIGYQVKMMGSSSSFSGYIFMSIYIGWKFIHQFIPNMFILFSLRAMLWYYLIRIGISLFVGIFTAPVYLGWCIYKLIRCY